MQIVINISDNVYERIKYLEPNSNSNNLLDILMCSVQNGTPLTGHGDLIDRDEVLANLEAAGAELSCGYGKGLHEAWEIIRDEDATPIILKAEGSGEK